MYVCGAIDRLDSQVKVARHVWFEIAVLNFGLLLMSLNSQCKPTNTKNTKPYDHVLFHKTHTTEANTAYGMEVIDLIKAVKPLWTGSDPYPGDPYDHNKFRMYFSDHHPVKFRMNVPAKDDD